MEKMWNTIFSFVMKWEDFESAYAAYDNMKQPIKNATINVTMPNHG